MKILVTYQSKTGNTERYAKWIAQQLQGEILPFSRLSKEKLDSYDVVIYGAGIYAGSLYGLKKILSVFQKRESPRLVLFATGGSPNAMVENITACWKNILPGETLERIPHYYMQAGINYERMKVVDKTLMKMMVTYLHKKKDKTEEETEAAEIMAKSYDIIDFSYAEPLISYVKGLDKL